MAIEGAYPFGPKAYWPRRAWNKAKRQYLARFDTPKPTPLFPDMPRDPVSGRPINV